MILYMGQKTKKQRPGRRMSGRFKNRVPVLEPDHDFYKAFDVDPSEKDLGEKKMSPEPDRGDDFIQLIESSLKGKSTSKILREKQDKKAREPIPLHKRIKRYPPPECDLDLHGYQALGATLYADSYIRTRLQQGIFTIRIIVGRGLHSEFKAVLPDAVEDLLTALKKEGIVLHFEWEKRKKSQSGAIIVYLKQFND